MCLSTNQRKCESGKKHHNAIFLHDHVFLVCEYNEQLECSLVLVTLHLLKCQRQHPTRAKIVSS